VERPEEDRKDLHGLQHERSRENAQLRLLSARRAGAPGVDAAHLGELAKAHPLDFRITNAAERLLRPATVGARPSPRSKAWSVRSRAQRRRIAALTP